MLTFKSNRFWMDYISFGSGKKPFIVLPGIALKPVITAEEQLKALFSRFCDTHTVYVFERRRNLPDGATVFDMADDMAAVMKKLNLPAADIYGASQGGMIALVLAAKYPELVANVMPISSLYKQNEKSTAAFKNWLSLYEKKQFKELNRSMFEGIYSEDYFNKYRNVFEQMIVSGTKKEFRRLSIMIKACLAFDATEIMGKIECPVFAVGSLADRVLTGTASKEIAEAVKYGSYHLYTDYSHAVYDEDPDFLRHIALFLNEH